MRLRFGGQSKLRPLRTDVTRSRSLPKASAILVTNTAVGDRQDAAASRRELRRFPSQKSRQRRRVAPVLQLQQLYLHPPGPILHPTIGSSGGSTGHPDADLCIRLSPAAAADRRRHFFPPPEELSKCWKVPSAASIEDLPPTSAIEAGGVGGEIESCSRRGGWSDKGWMVELGEPRR